MLFIVLPSSLVNFTVCPDESAKAVSLIVTKFALKTPLSGQLFFAVSVALAHIPVAVVGVLILRTGVFTLAVAVAVLHITAIQIAILVPMFFEISCK